MLSSSLRRACSASARVARAQRAASTLVVAEHDNSALNAATLHAVTAASQIGGDISVLVAGSGCDAVAAEAGAVAGVSNVLCAGTLSQRGARPLSRFLASPPGPAGGR